MVPQMSDFKIMAVSLKCLGTIIYKIYIPDSLV